MKKAIAALGVVCAAGAFSIGVFAIVYMVSLGQDPMLWPFATTFAGVMIYLSGRRRWIADTGQNLDAIIAIWLLIDLGMGAAIYILSRS